MKLRLKGPGPGTLCREFVVFLPFALPLAILLHFHEFKAHWAEPIEWLVLLAYGVVQGGSTLLFFFFLRHIFHWLNRFTDTKEADDEVSE